MIDDTVAFPVLEALAACLCQEIAAADLPEPCFCGVLAGQLVANEHCGSEDCAGDGCTGGQAWVRLAGVYPSSQFPVQDQDQATCATLLAVEIEVGVARCAPVVSDEGGAMEGDAPTLAQWHATTRLQMADMAAMRRAVLCCLGARSRDYLLGAYAPFGPEGGCVGGIWTVTVAEGAIEPIGPS